MSETMLQCHSCVVKWKIPFDWDDEEKIGEAIRNHSDWNKCDPEDIDIVII